MVCLCVCLFPDRHIFLSVSVVVNSVFPYVLDSRTATVNVYHFIVMMISIINSIHISLQEFCAEYLSITIAGRTDGL